MRTFRTKVSLTNRTHLTTSPFWLTTKLGLPDHVEDPIALIFRHAPSKDPKSLARMGSPFDPLMVLLQCC